MSTISATGQWLKHLPNKLTIARILVIPLLLGLYPLTNTLHIPCAVLFALAATTDLLDGYLARKYSNVTPLGALLDPIADKMLVAASLVLLANSGAVPALLAGLLVCRDIGVNGIRLMALEKHMRIEVSEFGKLKTLVLLWAIFCLMINQPLWGIPFREIGMVSLWIGLLISLYSAWNYGERFLQMSKNA
ncbi:MAG: CDP-diacylglycerol--glycerol-3-phosphate 3-phosphatidyltransferase [Deltaproteobacteria bacterium]|nr:CDP-diacylglycerol--glycerol-3-phosphate 3-phosphatidyltransferase [Deltaproteobacteria bacterium]